MKFRSTARCPYCSQEIVLTKVDFGHFACPVCQAVFRHDYRKWLLTVSLLPLVTFALFLHNRLGIFGTVVITTVSSALAVVNQWLFSPFQVVSQGTRKITHEQVRRGQYKINKWLLIIAWVCPVLVFIWIICSWILNR